MTRLRRIFARHLTGLESSPVGGGSPGPGLGPRTLRCAYGDLGTF